MMLHEATQQAGAHKRRKRVGRGEGSGHGKSSGRGTKGAQSRAGYSGLSLHEGGAFPLFRRLPKRGFSNFNFRTEYAPVNLGTLSERFSDGETVNAATLKQKGLVWSAAAPVKVLADGALSKKLTIEVHACSAKAKEAIEKAGGTLKLLARRDAAAAAQAKRGKGKAKAARAGKSDQKKS